jgi:hypothetical protein
MIAADAPVGLRMAAAFASVSNTIRTHLRQCQKDIDAVALFHGKLAT